MKLFLLMMFTLVSLAMSAQTPVTAADLDYRKDGNNYLLVLKRGQPLIASLVAFMEKEKLPGASLSGIGAVQDAEVAYYNINEKKYQYKKFDGSMEVLSLTGNLGYFENKPIVHAHVALGGPDFTMHGGHVREATVSLILEIFIVPTTKPITREWNKEFPELRTMKPVHD
ncbi:MAG: DNA-binding protein [Chitinophagaceae bacterium]